MTGERGFLIEADVAFGPDEVSQADHVERLLAALSRWTLDPRLEECGPFIDTHPRHCTIERRAETWERVYIPTTPLYPEHPGAVLFCGNFLDYSFGFRVATDDPEVIAKLTAAIELNRASDRYAAAKDEVA